MLLYNGCVNNDQLQKLAAILGGIPVWTCLKGSPAKNAGLRYGDIILEVNGQKTSNVDDYVAARSKINGRATFLVFRDGTQTKIEIDMLSKHEDVSMN